MASTARVLVGCSGVAFGGLGRLRSAKRTELTKTLSRVTNEVFAKLRHVTRLLEAQRKKEETAPPKVAPRAQIKDEDQLWFHSKLARSAAEALLKDQKMTNGLFLVRQSDRSETDFALSFCYNKRIYHNRIIKEARGYKNTKGTVWPSLGVMVIKYQSPHEDMQTVITEFVSREQEGPGGAYMNVSLIQEAAAARAAESKGGGKPWDQSAIKSVLTEISELGGSTMAIEEDGNIAYDPVYDEMQFGFGQDFINATLGNLKGGVQPRAELDLDSDDFHLGDIEGEAEC